MDIYLSDLKKEVQEKVLIFFNVKDEKDINGDIFPIFTLEKPEE